MIEIKDDQCHNWTSIFSLYCLRGLVPFSHGNCWVLFVNACHLLCCHSIPLDDTDDKLLLQFCETFEQEKNIAM